MHGIVENIVIVIFLDLYNGLVIIEVKGKVIQSLVIIILADILLIWNITITLPVKPLKITIFLKCPVLKADELNARMLLITFT